MNMNTDKWIVKARIGYFTGFDANNQPLFSECESNARRMVETRARMLAREFAGKGITGAVACK